MEYFEFTNGFLRPRLHFRFRFKMHNFFTLLRRFIDRKQRLLKCCRLGMRGIPVMEKYQCLLYFKWYDIIILLKSTCRWQCFPKCCETGKTWQQIMLDSCDESDTDETLSTHPKLINKENRRSEIWHYFSYKTDDKGERTDHRRQDIKSR